MVPLATTLPKVSPSAHSEPHNHHRGLSIQLSAAANDLKSALLHHHSGSPRLDSVDWSAIENKEMIFKDLSKTQKELETIARNENRKYLLKKSPKLSRTSSSAGSSAGSSGAMSNGLSQFRPSHQKRRSLLRDEDIPWVDDEATCVDSDTDYSSSFFSSIPSDTSIGSVSLSQTTLQAEPKQAMAVPVQPPSFSDGWTLTKRGVTIMSAAAMAKILSAKLLFSALVASLIALVFTCM